MPDLPSSAVRRALAAELRRLREHAGLSGDEVAARLGWSGSKVSRIETHRTGIKTHDLELLLSLYNVDEDQRSQLRALAAEQDGARLVDRLRQHVRARVPGLHRS